MTVEVTSQQARKIRNQLLNAPVAPGFYSYLINVGTVGILEALEENYFHGELADGIGCFKFVEGDYGSGKTQFINSLAQRAIENNIVVAIASIGNECPFNSPLAIFKSVMSAFTVPGSEAAIGSPPKGIEILFRDWIRRKLHEMGLADGAHVPDAARRQVERVFDELWLGAPDPQVASGLRALGKRLIAAACGGSSSVADAELIAWVRGEPIRSKALKEAYGLHEPARDENAFKRLRTVIGFLRQKMGYRGFLIAFDEGGRIISFRRGTVKQRQAIENMLTMINENAEGGFGGVMFVYAATPDFRSDTIKAYTALNDRIGSVPFLAGSPQTPLIVLERLQSDQMLMELGSRLLEIFAKADGVSFKEDVQTKNMQLLIETEKVELALLEVPPRLFVFHCCALLEGQAKSESEMNIDEMRDFVRTHKLPDRSEGNEKTA
jgi:hypothetical protein